MIELRRRGGVVHEICVRACRFEQHSLSDNKVVTYLRDELGDLRRQNLATR